jgi:hypothetical protein
MKHLKTFEEKSVYQNIHKLVSLTYEDVVEGAKLEDILRSYIISFYPSVIGDTVGYRMSNRFLHEDKIMKLLKIAKNAKDKKLMELIKNYTDYFDNLIIKRAAEKYNL